SASNLPNGLILSSSGDLSGDPTQAGTFEITVTVTDTLAGTSKSANDTIAVYPALALVNSLEASYDYDDVVSSQLQATGGSAPYTYSVLSGSLPDGLTLAADGTISGSPTAVGEYSLAFL